MLSERPCYEPYGRRREGYPDGYYYHGGYFVDRPVFSVARLFAALGEDGGWDHSYRERDPERNDEQIVEVPEDRDRVWYQVYGA